MRPMCRFAAFALAATFLLVRSPSAEALSFSFGGTIPVNDENANLTATSTWIALSDHFDLYEETHWVIVSAVEDSSGRIQVTYDFPSGRGIGTNYSVYIDVPFQIHSDSGNLTPEPVNVEVWGASFYQFQLFGGCCSSGTPQIDPIGPISYSATNGLFETFASTHTLFTNTDYFLTYRHSQYIESYNGFFLRGSFDSWDAYNAFADIYGTSGTTFVSASGFFDFNIALAPTNVPEPGTLTLLALGIAVLGLTRRRKANGTLQQV